MSWLRSTRHAVRQIWYMRSCFSKTLLPLHLTNKSDNTYWHFILFFMKNDDWRRQQQCWFCAGRYSSYFSWLHEEMTYCQKNPITLILKSNICFIKPNPYLADFFAKFKIIQPLCNVVFHFKYVRLALLSTKQQIECLNLNSSRICWQPIWKFSLSNWTHIWRVDNNEAESKTSVGAIWKKESGLAGKLCGCVSSMAISPLSRSGFRKKKTQKGEKRIVEIWGQENLLFRLSYFTLHI